MIRMPQLPQPTWAIHRAASKTVWFGEVDPIGDVDAVDEGDAIAKAAEQFKVPAIKLSSAPDGCPFGLGHGGVRTRGRLAFNPSGGVGLP
jgi:hypothetical protein